ncbi:MAG: hypothetical protein IAI50_10205 [Candidatus Eremiobacteraeota bacterium]|nr:hypothetical protein [Candidatus Eremiobacteraeota bacterium]
MATTSGGEAAREGRDYYFEGSAVVFTAAYHLRRGTCCGNGCRHCPFDHVNVPRPVPEIVSETDP